MRYAVLFSILLCVFFTGCNKEKFGSTPSLTFKSVNTTVLPKGDLIQFTLSFSAANKLSDSIYVEEIVPNCPGSNSGPLHEIMPGSYPKSPNQKGEIVITYGNNVSGYTDISAKCQQNDTAVFRFAIKDKANHLSDTVSSPKIIIIY